MTKEKKEIIGHINCLDDIEAYIDEMDETAGVSSQVYDALEILQNYFYELLRL